MSQTQKQKHEKPSVEEDQSELVSTETTPVSSVEGMDALQDGIADLAEELSIEDFTEPASGVNHGHSPDKHDVRSAFGVRDEFVEQNFHFAPNDHAAVWELHYRKDEFINSSEPLFEGKSDGHSQTWGRIEDRKQHAPIPDDAHRTLKNVGGL